MSRVARAVAAVLLPTVCAVAYRLTRVQQRHTRRWPGPTASATTSATGVTQPRVLETWANATSLVFGVMRVDRSATSNDSSSASLAYLRLGPPCCASNCGFCCTTREREHVWLYYSGWICVRCAAEIGRDALHQVGMVLDHREDDLVEPDFRAWVGREPQLAATRLIASSRAARRRRSRARRTRR